MLCRSVRLLDLTPIPLKITLALSKRSIEFFKREAAKHNTQYQRMIRRLLDAYAERYSSPETRPPSTRATK